MHRAVRFALPVFLLLLSSPAFADGFFSVGIGSSLGGSLAKSARTFPWQLGVMSHKGWMGVEGDYGALQTPAGQQNQRTLGVSILIGKRVSGWRPFGSVGWATLGQVNTLLDTVKVTGDSTLTNTLITVGGGLFGDLAKHVALQMDVRLFRDLLVDQGATRIQFTRASVSGVFKF